MQALPDVFEHTWRSWFPFKVLLELGINGRYVCVLCYLSKHTEQMEQLFFFRKVNVG